MQAEIPFRFRYHAHPLMRALAGVVAGYFTADSLGVVWKPLAWVGLLAAPLVLIYRWKPKMRFSMLVLAWFLAGWSHFSLHQPAPIVHSPSLQTTCLILESEPKTTAKGWKLRVSFQGRLWLAYGKGKPPQNSQPGQSWIVRFKPLPPPVPPLPGSFDFGRWMRRQGISGSISLVSFQPLPSHYQVFRWKNFWGELRKRFQSFLLQHAPDRTVVYWIEALLLGQDDGLSETIQLDFRNTGTLHVLAISGLHVGLLYWLIDRLLVMLRLKDRWKQPFLLFFLWSFALLTDLPESICRASLMYSFSMLAQMKGRMVEGSHSLCGSALLMLWLKPASLWSAGFLLSHAAVAGLILIYPLFDKLQDQSPCWLRWITEGFFLSISAQLATLPFCFNLFGQFPTWFWLANLWAVPLSTICLGASILWIPLQLLPITESLADWGLVFLIKAMCWPVEQIADWPLSIFTLPPIPLLSMLGFTGIFLLLIFFLKGYRPHPKWSIGLLSTCLLGYIQHHVEGRLLDFHHRPNHQYPTYHFIRKGEASVLLVLKPLSSRDSSALRDHFKWYPCQKKQTFYVQFEQRDSLKP